MIDKPTCPECPDDAEYSVREGVSMRTCIGRGPPRWDEDGNYHRPPDPNTTKTTYHCSNGHTWTEVRD